jgi:acetoin utilization deacetylase AcuC-like enzyme
MKTIYSEEHKLRDAKTELCGGQLVPPFECPVRAEYVIQEVKRRQLGDIILPQRFDRSKLLSIHDADYLDFLETCWDDWQAAGYKGEAIASCAPSRRLTRAIPPREIDGRIGYYCLASETSISGGTWEAAYLAADIALTGAELLSGGEKSAFSLCRPPGHHAAQDMFGGYCFINNAAVAAQSLLDSGASKVAILDVDFHHGNGTQSIFYDRSDVLFCSLHGDPMDTFPYFLGGADEVGEGQGYGFNINYPMPPKTPYSVWVNALDAALKQVSDFGADALIISLGVDTYEHDPISSFRLQCDDFIDYGARIATLNLPTLFVMEGGYAVEEIGTNVVNVLEGFSNR